MTYLSVPIAGKNVRQAARQIKEAIAADAEMLELRVDYLENLSIASIEKLISIVNSRVPLIVTCRDKKQGGVINYPLKLRVEVYPYPLSRQKIHAITRFRAK